MRHKSALALIAVIAVLVAFLYPGAAAEASLASLGYTLLGRLDRADVVHHDIRAEVDPERMTARFWDDVTLVSGGSDTLYVLLGADARLQRVSDAEGRDVSFSPTMNWISLPFAIYEIPTPGVRRGERFRLRFEWSISPETVKRLSPFVALRFFYAGYDMLWYPNMPGEEFFEAEIRVTVPQGYAAIADGELAGVEPVRTVAATGREDPSASVYHYRTPAPVMGLGLGVGRFRALEPVELVLDDGSRVEIQPWQPVGWISSVQSAASYAASAVRYLSRHLGTLPVNRFFVAHVPFPVGASYASLYGHVYGGDLSDLGPGAPQRDNDGLSDDHALALVAAHEAAHKWLGGVAGMRLVGSAWLSEGLAEYLAYLVLVETLGQEAALSTLEGRVYLPYTRAAQGRQRALANIDLLDEGEPLVYQKGALVFRMLHRRLGDDAFFALIRSFVQQHRGQVVTGQTFIDHAEAFAATWRDPLGGEGRTGAGGTSPDEMRAFFEQWVKGSSTLDYALRVMETSERRLVVRAVSAGRIVEPGPVSLSVELDDGRRLIAEIALDETVEFNLPASPRSVMLDHERWLADANPANNVWYANPAAGSEG